MSWSSSVKILKSQSMNVSGRIVLFAEDWQGYGATVRYRNSAHLVERAGGIGLLVKSVTPFSLGTPHTGAGYNSMCVLYYKTEFPKRCNHSDCLHSPGRGRTAQAPLQARQAHCCGHGHSVKNGRNMLFSQYCL